MNLRRLIVSFVLLAVVAGVAYVGQKAEPPGAKMTGAANDFLGSLTEEQKKKAAFTFDDPHRTKWYFTPQQDSKKQPTRKGIPLKDLNEQQRKLAIELLAAGTSQTGKEKALAVMALESVLRELEKGAGPGRDPDWYFLSIFGKPGMTGKWSWRIEGHHLSLNFTISDGKLASGTPAFYGSNPREILAGDRKGFRALPKEEDLARQLLKSLTDDQRKAAVLSEQVPRGHEIPEGIAEPKVPATPQGLAAAKMTADQKRILTSLLQEYTGNLAGDLNNVLMKEVMDAGIDKIHFAWWGGSEARQPHSYRIQGPTFLLEFVCVQNEANHIHSCWRSLKADFGAGQ